MPQIPPDPELKAIESALGDLVPRSSKLDRDRLMFQAGAMTKRGAKERRWVWPAITAVASCALAGESLFLVTRPAPRVVERIVLVPAPPAASVAVASAPDLQADTHRGLENPSLESPAVVSLAMGTDYQRIQELVSRFGLDAIPERGFVTPESGDGDSPIGAELKPAGALRSLELEKILKPGGPS